MIVFRSLLRVNFLPREPLIAYQKCKFWRNLSCGLNMDARNRTAGRNRRGVTQTWRALSTEPNYSEGDGERAMLQNKPEEQHSTSSSVPYTCPTAKNSIGVSLHENLTSPKMHSLSLEIGSSLMRFIKGKGGGTQQEIEVETGVKIIFPSSKNEDSIILEGDTAESITQASDKIQTIVDKAVNSRDLDYSHFVSLPLAIYPGLVNKLLNFQNTILGISVDEKERNMDNDMDGDTSVKQDQPTVSKVSVELKVEKADADDEINVKSDQHPTETPLVAEVKAVDVDTPVKVNVTNIPLVSYHPKEKKRDLGIDKSIFIKPQTFHLTVLMLKLWNKERVKAATEVLQSVSSKVMDALENRPVSIRLKGLDCIKGSEAKAFVLYAPVEEIGGEGRLLRACKVITDAFVDAGLVIGKDADRLKLHATLMNARHRKRKFRSGKVEPFDARGIFELYGKEEWGDYVVSEAHLSQRFVFDENGYYHCCASIPFPHDKHLSRLIHSLLQF